MRRKRIPSYMKLCRKRTGLTQKEVARILGLESSSMISRWERGESIPETINALRISALYQTTVDYIYEDLRLDMLGELIKRTESVLQAK